MRVLIVDDEPGIGELYEAFIADHGCCDLVYDGLEAVTIFKKAHTDSNPYDLICLDIMMPNMSGREALKAIREHEEELGLVGLDGVKVIMLTARCDVDSVIGSFFDDRCEAYLKKPIERHELIKTIAELGLINA